ncbi:MAG: tRNA uridine-5-carboxymethylaminomethyl(34) synthesis GTPase MnmE [Oscillospiraceae bacterium]|nr:tRNA uridine-5-carboxymethylaminomethyl(34) synthesis GTPase MnmE [Oscillospiraceae bacterium]
MQSEAVTIAAVSTPLGVGGIGVIRVSGPRAHRLAAEVFRPVGGRTPENCPGYSAVYGRLFDEEGEFDDAVVTVFRAPYSYTGEDVAEISCHGGVYLVQRALRALIRRGVQPAAPGEFTKRAFLNGKLSLTQAEAVMDLISAQGTEAARAALTLRDGALFRSVHGLEERLLALAGHLAAWVDYPDEEIEEVDPAAMASELAAVAREGKRLLATFDAGKILREGVETVIAGSPNVGKSTLMNLLAGCEKSIVTEIPGTTRDVVEEMVRVGDVILRLADTAGLRNTEDPVERTGVTLARRRLDTAGLVLAVFDSSRPLGQEDRELLAAIRGRAAVAVVNKSDLPTLLQREEVEAAAAETVWLSAASGEGVDVLSAAIARVIGQAQLDTTSAMIANERQRDCLCRALSSVEEAAAALGEGQTLDAVDVCVEDAIQHLGDLTGERAGDLVVEQVFSRFCVGK